MTDTLNALLTEKDENLDTQLREESRQDPTPEPSEKRPSPPQEEASAQTPPASTEPDLKNWVPLSAHLEEKAERKRLEKLYQDAAQERARLDERYKLIEERLRPQPQVPDKAQDPVGYLEAQIEQAKKAAEPVQQLQQRLEAWEMQQRVAATVGNAEQEFAKGKEDYWNAVEHIRQARLKQYALAGLDAQQQVQALHADTANWTISLLRAEKNPAEATYELAKSYGYVNGAGPAQPGNQPAPTSNGAVDASNRNPDGTFRSPNTKVEKAKETLRTVERGQQASKASVGDSPGGSPDTDLPSPTELASMDDEQFDRYLGGKNWSKYWKSMESR